MSKKVSGASRKKKLGKKMTGLNLMHANVYWWKSFCRWRIIVVWLQSTKLRKPFTILLREFKVKKKLKGAWPTDVQPSRQQHFLPFRLLLYFRSVVRSLILFVLLLIINNLIQPPIRAISIVMFEYCFTLIKLLCTLADVVYGAAYDTRGRSS